VLPESLESLAGPVGGVVRLPLHLAWSGGAVYDLDSPGRVVDLYRTVIIEAAAPEDLHAYLNAAVLRRFVVLSVASAGGAADVAGAVR
jgi:hypothetical protein